MSMLLNNNLIFFFLLCYSHCMVLLTSISYYFHSVPLIYLNLYLLLRLLSFFILFNCFQGEPGPIKFKALV